MEEEKPLGAARSGGWSEVVAVCGTTGDKGMFWLIPRQNEVGNEQQKRLMTIRVDLRET